MRWLRLMAIGLALAGVAQPAAAQTADAARPRSPVLTVDQEALFTDSLRGQSMLAEIDEASRALAAENRRIEAELVAEEQALTDQRPTLDAVTFRERAAAFDAKVVRIRNEQDEKARQLVVQRDKMQQEFYTAALPVLTEIVRDRGALVVLDSRSVIMAAGTINITRDAIALLDEAFQEPDTQPGQDGPQ